MWKVLATASVFGNLVAALLQLGSQGSVVSWTAALVWLAALTITVIVEAAMTKPTTEPLKTR